MLAMLFRLSKKDESFKVHVVSNKRSINAKFPVFYIASDLLIQVQIASFGLWSIRQKFLQIPHVATACVNLCCEYVTSKYVTSKYVINNGVQA